MIIELDRLRIPEDLGIKEECGICGGDFELGVVFPQILGEGRVDEGVACSGCVEFMGRHPSGRFPTIEEYRRLEGEWKTPLYASAEEADAAFLASAES